FLNSKINPGNDPNGPHVQVIVTPDDIRFRLTVNKQFLRQDIPFAFDLGGNLGFADLEGDGVFNVVADAGIDLTLGVRTDPDLLLADGPSLGSGEAGAEPEIHVGVTVNAGYDLNDDGDTSDSGEGEPMAFAAAVGPLQMTVAPARGLLNLDLAADILGGPDG